MAAPGARNSNHTAITLGSASSLVVGTRREAAYKALAQHAVDLARNCKILSEVTPRALEAVNLLRAALFVVSPKHAFAGELVDWGHRHFVDLTSFAATSDTALNNYSVISLVIHDAMIAVAHERPLQIADSQLSQMGWNRPPMFPGPDGPQQPSDYERQIARVRTGATVLRALARHQSRGALTNPEAIRQAFRDLWSLADEHLASIFAIGPNVLEISARLYGIHVYVEAIISKLALRECSGSEASDVLVTAQRRYLSCLKLFMLVLNPRSSSAADLHNLLSALEALPGWLELALNGANQFEHGNGSLASVGFCWDDLHRLLRLLETLGSISGSSDAFRVNLEQAMVAAGISTSSSTLTPHDGTLRLPSEFRLPTSRLTDEKSERLATALVEQALEEIGA